MNDDTIATAATAIIDSMLYGGIDLRDRRDAARNTARFLDNLGLLTNQDTTLSPNEMRRLLTITTVVRTLRQVAEWGPMSRDDLRAVADDVHHGPLTGSCPMCQEIVCDTECPLAPIREDTNG